MTILNRLIPMAMVFSVAACSPSEDVKSAAMAKKDPSHKEITMAIEDKVHPTLHAHSQEFEKRVYPIAQNVHLSLIHI